MKAKIIDDFIMKNCKLSKKDFYTNIMGAVNIDNIQSLTAATMAYIGTYLLNNAKNEEKKNKIKKTLESLKELESEKHCIVMIKHLEILLKLLEEEKPPLFFITAVSNLLVPLAVQIELCKQIEGSELRNKVDDLMDDLEKEFKSEKFESLAKKFVYNFKGPSFEIHFSKFFNVDTKVKVCVTMIKQKIKVINLDSNNSPKIPSNPHLIKIIIAKVVNEALLGNTIKEKSSEGFVVRFSDLYKVSVKENDTFQDHPELIKVMNSL